MMDINERYEAHIKQEIMFLVERVRMAHNEYQDRYGVKADYIILPHSSNYKLSNILGLKVVIVINLDYEQMFLGRIPELN